jgi:FdhE protein
LSQTTLDAWLGTHPYLVPVGLLCTEVEAAAAASAAAAAAAPDWEDYAADYRAGVPLLRSLDAGIDLRAGGRAALALVEHLASNPSGGKLAADVSALREELRAAGASPGAVMDFLLGEETLAPSSPGLLRYLGWAALARHLGPVVASFAAWRDEERWLRSACPTCGSPPAMAQLVGRDPGRMRLLSCGCCGTRWQFSRTACPFCEKDDRKLTSLAVSGEAGLRIDSCDACQAYVKTYDGEGDEAVLLLDWTSLHLDVLAHDCGLKRNAASLYEIEPLLRP